MDSSEIKRGVRPNGHDSDEILSDIRITRNRMDNTLNELGDKLQPRHLVEDAVDYFWTREHQAAGKAKESVTKMGRKVVDEVREHPLPSLLIGAGVIWLLSQQRNRTARIESGEEAGPGLKEKAKEMLGSAKERLQGLKEGAKGGTESLKEKASGMKEKASEVSGKAREKIGSALGAASDKSSEIKEKAKGYCQQTSQRLHDTSETHPLAVGLGCMVAGILAGVMAPRTRVEDEAFGDRADQVKGEVKEKAEVLKEQGRELAQAARGSGEEQAIGGPEAMSHQDLTPEGLTGRAEEFKQPGEHKAGPGI